MMIPLKQKNQNKSDFELISDLGGSHNIAACNVEPGNIYIIIKSVKLLKTRNIIGDSYARIWINDYLLNLKVTFDTHEWLKNFKDLSFYE